MTASRMRNADAYRHFAREIIRTPGLLARESEFVERIGSGQTMQDIATDCGITRERVRQIASRALRRYERHVRAVGAFAASAELDLFFELVRICGACWRPVIRSSGGSGSMCGRCKYRNTRYGNPLFERAPTWHRDRFWDRVDKCSGELDCWPWTGPVNDVTGYGVCGGPSRYSHRRAWELSRGRNIPEPPGNIVRHLCDNKICCNPLHLKVGTQADNVADRQAAGAWHAAMATARMRTLRSIPPWVIWARSDHRIEKARAGGGSIRRGGYQEICARYGKNRSTMGSAIYGYTHPERLLLTA